MPHPLPAECLKGAEVKLGHRFQHGYAGRLLRENGGAVDCGDDLFELYPVRDGTDRERLARTAVDVTVETASAHEWPGFPESALAVGHNGGGDLLILLPDPHALADAPRFADAVLLWDHEMGGAEVVADGFENLPGG